MSKEFPYTAWKLTPGFKPVEVTIARDYNGNWRSDEVTHLVTDNGRYFPIGEIYPDRATAIAGGYKRLATQQADLDKKAANIAKKRAALEKAGLQA